MAQVLLINPSYTPSYGGTKVSVVNPIYPTLGLATIAATALERGHKVEILDMSWRPYDFELIRNLILKIKPDIVGITATTPLMNQLRDISVLVKDISKNIKTSHLGSKSHTEHLQFQSLLNRNWHYNWSKFYYFKKHHGYFFGLKKTFPNLIRSLKKYISCRFFSKNHEYKLYYAEISGLISSYLKKPASYRPYEKK